MSFLDIFVEFNTLLQNILGYVMTSIILFPDQTTYKPIFLYVILTTTFHGKLDETPFYPYYYESPVV